MFVGYFLFSDIVLDVPPHPRAFKLAQARVRDVARNH
jgi:hypothetical protein